MPLGENSKDKDFFAYRFIKFKFETSENKFKPIIYDIKKNQSEIITNLSLGVDEADVPKLKDLYGLC
jgi:hypothetical protein